MTTGLRKAIDYHCILFDLDETLCEFSTSKNDTRVLANTVLTGNDINCDDFWQSYEKLEPSIIDGFFHNTISQDDFSINGSFRVLDSMTQNADTVSMQLNKLFMQSLNSVTLFDDVIPFLSYLGNTDIKTALVTNGALIGQKNKIVSTGLNSYFKHIYISGQVRFAKPDKRFFFDYALSDMGVTASRTIMIGNSIKDDFHGAVGAGIDFVLMDRYEINTDFTGTRVHKPTAFQKTSF